MSGLLLFASLFVFAISSFQYTYLTGDIYRTYLGLYKGIAESSVFAYKDDGSSEKIPYFHQQYFFEAVTLYFYENQNPIVGEIIPTIRFDYSGSPYSARMPDIAYVNVNVSMGIYGTFDKTAKFQVVRS